MKTVVIPVVVGALGTVKKGMVENIKKVSERATMTEIQKICMLGSARIPLLFPLPSFTFLISIFLFFSFKRQKFRDIGCKKCAFLALFQKN